MANYNRYKIRLYPVSGQLKPEDFIEKAKRLKAADTIYETMDLYYPHDLDYGEMHFTMKWFPESLEDIFDPDKYDTWTIHADEGGAADSVRFETNRPFAVEPFEEKAIYTADTIRLAGSAALKEKVHEAFGPGIKRFISANAQSSFDLKLPVQYTNNSFFYNQGAGHMTINEYGDITSCILRATGEFREMIFHTEKIKFIEQFYIPAFSERENINPYPYLNEIGFYSNGRVTNRIAYELLSAEWAKDSQTKCWQHTAEDGFHNCANARFKAYELLRKTAMEK